MILENMSGLLCLKWNNHSAAFNKTLNTQRIKEAYCDATIVCHGKFFPVHKLVLTVCSEYFELIFSRIECRHPFIIIKDIQPQEIEALLNYMYKGEVNVLQEMLPGLIKAAEALRIKGLAVPDDEDYSEDESYNTKDKKRSCSSSSPSPLNKKSRKSPDKKTNTTYSSPSNNKETSKKETTADSEKDLVNAKDIKTDDTSNFNGSSNNDMNEDPSLDMNSTDNLNTSDVKMEQIDFVDDNYSGDDPLGESNSENEGSLFQTLLGGDAPSILQKNLSLLVAENQSLAQCSSWNNLNHSNEGNMNNNTKNISEEEVHDGTEQLLSDLPMLNGTEPYFKRLWESGLQCLSDNSKSKAPPKIFKTCPYCPYQSRIISHLKRHIICKHTLERPFKCNYCSYETGHGSNLKMHEMTHTGEKPYACTYCPYRATRNDCIVKHMKQHEKTMKI